MVSLLSHFPILTYLTHFQIPWLQPGELPSHGNNFCWLLFPREEAISTLCRVEHIINALNNPRFSKSLLFCCWGLWVIAELAARFLVRVPGSWKAIDKLCHIVSYLKLLSSSIFSLTHQHTQVSFKKTADRHKSLLFVQWVHVPALTMVRTMA